MSKQKSFTQAFEGQALTSGRTRRALAEGLGAGLSTLTRSIGWRCDRESARICRCPKADRRLASRSCLITQARNS